MRKDFGKLRGVCRVKIIVMRTLNARINIMKKMWKKLGFLLVALMLTGGVFISCDDNDGGSDTYAPIIDYGDLNDDGSIFIISRSSIEGVKEEFRDTIERIDFDDFPEGITTISRIRDCPKLKTINIPDSITEINGSAFSGCASLESVTLPKNITKIDERTFLNCTSLKGITIPDGVTEIGTSAFSGCTSLKSITIPDGVTEIFDIYIFGLRVA